MTSVYAFINFFQHQAASFEGGRLWIERSQASSDQIGVDKTERLGFGRQEVTGKCGFPCAVGSCNDDDFFQVFGALLSSNEPFELGAPILYSMCNFAMEENEEEVAKLASGVAMPKSAARNDLVNKVGYVLATVSKKKKALHRYKALSLLAPRPGLEPGTYGLTGKQARQKTI